MDVYKVRRFGDWLSPKRHISFSDTSDFINLLTRLSARENFITTLMMETVSLRNVGFYNSPDMAVSPRKRY
jgi:hypothetical protein